MALYDQYTLGEVFRRQKTSANPFWISFFPRQINFTTPEVAFDKVFTDDRKLAPFVAPNVQGRPQSLDGHETWSFKPAYIKIKDVVHAEMHLDRVAGEDFGTGGNTLTIDQRRQAVIATLLASQKTRLANRLEWMAARAVIDAKVVISGEDYPAVTLDFKRDPSLTATLTGAAKWDQATGDPLGDLKDMRINANERSGVRITKHVFGANAFDLFSKRVDLKELMNVNYGGLEVRVSRINDSYGDTMEYIGTIAGLDGAGRIEIWVNTARYIDPDTGALTYYLDQNTVVGVSDSINGARCFGAINDARAQYQALSVFNKNWINEDPSVEYLLMQSAPLMVPGDPDASYSIKVA